MSKLLQIQIGLSFEQKTGKLILISGVDANGVAFQESVKPISFGEESMYNRWIRKMNQITEKLSNGKVGYVHVQGMNDGSFRVLTK
jgi:uncharacterized protein YwbE